MSTCASVYKPPTSGHTNNMTISETKRAEGQPIHGQNSTIKGVNWDLEKLPHNPASKTGVQIGEEADCKCRGLTGLPNLKEPRAIKVNSRQFKAKGRFMAVSYPKSE
ncbi:hypothetical protein SLEP1_g56112 [Rubroshorea leprosula]|uniref:Uncharacterized protein n=1 Tax=Rubroshorea leprosula TaxID=152421 RepID=A0AAV5MLB1_9ROSI|nr:hypothetical protein SLEP1_g56112 [Rubroshorea leprosula]